MSIKPGQNYPNATTERDEAWRNIEAIEQQLDGYRVTCDTLRSSLHDREKRHEEAKLLLEVAHNKLGEAQSKLNHLSACNGVLIDERNKAKADRNAAIARAAGLRSALELLLWSCVHDDGELTVPSRCVVHEATAALDPPGPSIGEIKAEALEDVSKFSTHTITLYDERGWHYTKAVVLVEKILAEADRLRTGGGA